MASDAPADPSAAPVRARGTHTRAGNAMTRTRAAVIDGTVRAVEKYGSRKTTMNDIAALAGIAKATLYNHFRTKHDVYVATVDAVVADLGAECAALAGEDLAEALSRAAERVAGSGAVRRLAADEPAALAAFTVTGSGPAWRTARQAVAATLSAAGRDAGDPAVGTVLRWVASHAADPGSAEQIRCGASALAVGLPARAAATSEG